MKILFMAALVLFSGATAQAKPTLMASLGDSITAAAFANLPLAPASQSGPEQRVREWAAESLRPAVLIENKRTLSWASGILIRSHFIFLREHLARNGDARGLRVMNVAESGARADDMPKQARRIADAMNSGVFDELTYVTMFIGSNDACAEEPGGTPVESMRANLMMAMEILAGIQQQGRIPVLLPGLVQITDLGKPEIRNHRTIFGLRCGTVRDDILRFCRPLTTWRTQAERARADAIVDEKNRLLEEVAREANARFPNLDVFFTPVLHNIEIEPFMLASDCFHPAASGQQIISDELWMEQPFFEDDVTRFLAPRSPAASRP